jgi:hypothetical protein
MILGDYIQVIEFTHPGAQMPFKLGKGYQVSSGKIYREWNQEKQHKRKFICNKGKYINNIESKVAISEDLLFWGEWEGYSWFENLPENKGVFMPNGIHYPFFNSTNPGQNTDPYIYSETFMYAVCKQVKSRLQLAPNSVIIFGTEYKDHFAVDTIFVVDDYIPASKLHQNSCLVTETYYKATIERLPDYFSPNLSHRLYHGKTWSSGLTELFSFVPCKLKNEETSKGFGRLSLPHDWAMCQLGFQKPGARTVCHTIHTGILKAKEIWEKLAVKCIEQGFVLGIQFEEPKFDKI